MNYTVAVSKIVAKHNVMINNILPGKMDTDRLRGGFRMASERTGRSDRGERPSRPSNPGLEIRICSFSKS